MRNRSLHVDASFTRALGRFVSETRVGHVCARTVWMVDAEAVEVWGRALYCDPCFGCGYDWSMSAQESVELVAAVPASYSDLLAGTDGTQRHPDLEWTAGAYVCHVTDNLRIWAERLAGAALGGVGEVSEYDENLLARARAYEHVPLAGALWSLQRAARDWQEAIDLGLRQDLVLIPTGRGEQRATDVARNNAHDAYHHAWDIRRALPDDHGRTQA
jgi:hypothetical protein